MKLVTGGKLWDFNNMRNDNDCGIVTVSTVTRIPYETVESKWPGGFKGNQSDSFIHHQEVLNRLGFRYKTLSKEDVLAGKFVPGITAIMINWPDNPSTLIPENLIALHWCVMFEAKNCAWLNGRNRVFHLWLGNGMVTSYSEEELKVHLENPFCVAYTVERDPNLNSLPWYKRLYTRITSWF